MWHGLFPSEPRYNGMVIRINQEPRSILPGENIFVHASDKIKIMDISTNILFNVGIRLTSDGFDVNALRHEEMPISMLLPDQNIFDHYVFSVSVQYQDSDLGQITWDIQPYAEDWIEKANKTIKSDQKLAILEKGLAVLPEDSSIRRRLLDEYKEQKLWKRAAGMLETSVEKDPNPEDLAELIEIYTAMSSRSKMISVLKKLIKLDPDDVNLKLKLAEMLEQSKKYSSAIGQYKAAVKQLTGKKEKLFCYERIAFLYTNIKSYKRAITYYKKAVALNPKDANLYYNLSYLYEQTKQPQKAFEYLEKAAALNSTDVESRLVLAQQLLDKGDLKKAEKFVTQVLKKNSKSLKALLLKARIAEKKGDKKELRQTYKKIHTLDPHDQTVLYNLGALHYEAGELSAALSYLDIYIKGNPKDVAAREIIYDIHRKQKNDNKAFQEALTLSKLKPKRADLFFFMFDYLNRQKKYSQMIPILKMGVKANPKNADLREHLLFVYLESGKDNDALKQMKALVSLKPKDIALKLKLARLLEKQEKPGEAMKVYKEILDLSPDNEPAGEAYLRLRIQGITANP